MKYNRYVNSEIDGIKDDIERAAHARLVPELTHKAKAVHVCSVRKLIWDELLNSFKAAGFVPVPY